MDHVAKKVYIIILVLLMSVAADSAFTYGKYESEILTDLKHKVMGNGSPGLMERMIRVEMTMYGLVFMNLSIIGMLTKLTWFPSRRRKEDKPA